MRNESDHYVYNNNYLLNRFKDTMKSQLKMKDLGKISWFLGIEFEQDGNKIKMNQKRYTLEMLEKFGMTVNLDLPHLS